jgi:hypothetical protein
MQIEELQGRTIGERMGAFQEIQRLVGTVTYKYGWRIGVDVFSDYIRIFIGMSVPDVTNPSLPIEVGLNRMIPFDRLMGMGKHWPEAVTREIYDGILALECHEASEWFKVDGKAIFNEHDLKKEQ